MSQIKKMMMPVLFAAMSLLVFSGCGDSNSDSVFDTETGSHPAGWFPTGHAAAAKGDQPSCTECHGADYSGGISQVSCVECHGSASTAAFSCTSCHAQPPASGAHAVHNAFQNVTNVCDTCHSGVWAGAVNHLNGTADVQFLILYDAKSGTAVRNTNGTCSNVSCHGGQTTPVWLTGTLDVNTQCTSCHSYGTSQFNSFVSGRHDSHVNTRGFSCLVCHGTDTLAASHFTTLNTSAMEGPASATITGSLITSYSGGSCATICHTTRSW